MLLAICFSGSNIGMGSSWVALCGDSVESSNDQCAKDGLASFLRGDQ